MLALWIASCSDHQTVVFYNGGYPFICRSITESRKRHEEKQQKAQELREKLLLEKAERLRMLAKKVCRPGKNGSNGLLT